MGANEKCSLNQPVVSLIAAGLALGIDDDTEDIENDDYEDVEEDEGFDISM